MHLIANERIPQWDMTRYGEFQVACRSSDAHISSLAQIGETHNSKYHHITTMFITLSECEWELITGDELNPSI